MYGSLFLCLILVYLGPVKGIFHAKSILIYIKAFVFWINSQMLSLCGLWINNKHKGRIKHYFVTVEPKKGSQVLEKKYSACMVCTVCSLRDLRFGVTENFHATFVDVAWCCYRLTGALVFFMEALWAYGTAKTLELVIKNTESLENWRKFPTPTKRFVN